jgi:hypothetical protein
MIVCIYEIQDSWLIRFNFLYNPYTKMQKAMISMIRYNRETSDKNSPVVMSIGSVRLTNPLILPYGLQMLPQNGLRT